MIFVTDAGGDWVHVSRECLKLTGQGVAEALGRGWLKRVHPDDRAIVAGIFATATASAEEFSVRYRLLKPDDTARWVSAGGVPSFGMEENRFIGYLGSVTELAEGGTDTIEAYGRIGRFAPPAPHPNTLPSCDLDLIADYLLLTHSLMEGGSGSNALPDVRSALSKVGRELAVRTLVDPRLKH